MSQTNMGIGLASAFLGYYMVRVMDILVLTRNRSVELLDASLGYDQG